MAVALLCAALYSSLHLENAGKGKAFALVGVRGRCSNQFRDRAQAVVQQTNRTALMVGQRRHRVDAKHVVERGQHVLRRVRLALGDFAARGRSSRRPLPGRRCRPPPASMRETGLRPVVATSRRALLRSDAWCATHLAPDDHRHVLVQAAGRADRSAARTATGRGLRQHGPQTAEDVVVMIPFAITHRARSAALRAASA